MKMFCLISIAIFSLVFCLYTLIQPVLAASTLISKIGLLDITENYKHWWYTSENPTLQGQIESGAAISITIDSETTTVTAETGGNWTLAPTTLTSGDHQIDLSSGTDSYSFTLTIGAMPDNLTATASGEANMPVSGNTAVTLLLFLSGSLLTLTTFKRLVSNY